MPISAVKYGADPSGEDHPAENGTELAAHADGDDGPYGKVGAVFHQFAGDLEGEHHSCKEQGKRHDGKRFHPQLVALPRGFREANLMKLEKRGHQEEHHRAELVEHADGLPAKTF